MSRRLRSLNTIIRLRDQELKTHAAELVGMQAALGHLEAGRAELQRMRVEECRVEDPAAMAYVASFLAQTHRQDRLMARQQDALAVEVETKRREVLEAWREGKVVCHLADRVRDDARRKLERGELQASDERTIMSLGRRGSRAVTAPQS